MTPTKIILERTATHIQLRVLAAGTTRGFVVIESAPFRTGKAIPKMREYAAAYAKRFAIPFYDHIQFPHLKGSDDES